MLTRLILIFLLYMACHATSIGTLQQSTLNISNETMKISRTICIKSWDNNEGSEHIKLIDRPLESCFTLSFCNDYFANVYTSEKLWAKLQNSQQQFFLWGVTKENLSVKAWKNSSQEDIQETFFALNENSENSTLILCFHDSNIGKKLLHEMIDDSNSEAENINTNSLDDKDNENSLSSLSKKENIKSFEFITAARQLDSTNSITSYDRDDCLLPEIFSWVIMFIILVSLIHSLASPEINGVFFFISLLQSNNLLAYINYSFSDDFTCFYKSLDYFNFEVFLNIPKIIKDIFTDDYVVSSVPSVFEIYGYSSDWFVNGGQPFTALIILFVLWLIVKALSLIKFGTEVLPLMLQQIHDLIVWNGVIRFLQVTFLSLLMASLLQFHDISFDTLSNILGFAFAILTCVILIFFVGNSFRLMKSRDLRDKSVKNRVGAIYNDYWLDKETDKITVNIETIIMIKKAIQVATVIWLGHYPMVQTIIFLATDSFQTILLFGKRRFKDKTAGKIINAISSTNFLNILVLCCMFLMEDKETLREIFAWVAIAISIIGYLVNIFLVIAEQVFIKEEISEFYRKLCYGCWLFILGFFSCFCFVCINVNNFYWSRRARKNDNIKNSELALL